LRWRTDGRTKFQSLAIKLSFKVVVMFIADFGSVQMKCFYYNQYSDNFLVVLIAVFFNSIKNLSECKDQSVKASPKLYFASRQTFQKTSRINFDSKFIFLCENYIRRNTMIIRQRLTFCLIIGFLLIKCQEIYQSRLRHSEKLVS